jgi:two-component system CheB/CheR fusion protein
MATRKTRETPAKQSNAGRAGAEDHAFEALLDYLKRNRGFDFTGYKRSTLVRRVSKRMHEVRIDDYVAYQDYLEVHPDEFALLFNTILINVTAFFRDLAAWEYLAMEIVPAVLEAKPAGVPIRVWSAGCTSGEEAYTLAMLLAEAMGPRSFRERVKIYATDIDEEALAAARRALYSPREVEAVPEALRKKYFERQDTHYAFRPELRRSVIFGRHDLVQDAPISRIDLLVCRNVLMYLNAETQNRVLARLHFGLAPSGHLFLGKAEMLLTHADLFVPVDLKHRVFGKAAELGMRQRLAVLAEAGNASARTQLEVQEHVLDAAVDANPAAQIVVDAAGVVMLINQAAQELFLLTAADCGRPLLDLEISYRPVELRSLIERAQEEGRTVRITDVEKAARNEGESRYLDVEVTPLRNGERSVVGVSIAFLDRTERTQLRQDLERTREQLEHSNEELQSANEELETTNEELQSTNEELETTNEELQSGNEELETMNEELQSTNEELRTINEQLQLRTEQARASQTYLEAVLEGLRAAVVVVDQEFQILSWVEKMRELWGLREDEVRGQSLFDLDIGLPVETLRPAIEACLRGDQEVPQLAVDAVNRRGASIRCAVTCTPLRQEQFVSGAIVLMQRIGADDDPPRQPPRSTTKSRRGSSRKKA